MCTAKGGGFTYWKGPLTVPLVLLVIPSSRQKAVQASDGGPLRPILSTASCAVFALYLPSVFLKKERKYSHQNTEGKYSRNPPPRHNLQGEVFAVFSTLYFHAVFHYLPHHASNYSSIHRRRHRLVNSSPPSSAYQPPIIIMSILA